MPRASRKQDNDPVNEYFPRQYRADEDLKEEIRARPWLRRKIRAAYAHHLGPPPQCKPGDTQRARFFFIEICNIIARGGWSHAEQNSLYNMRNKWRRRANGDDMLFNIRGNRTGRPRKIEAAMLG